MDPDAFDEQIEATLLPILAPLGFRVAYGESSESFGDALVVLDDDSLRLRVVRDRGQVLADFASRSQPGRWFDSAVVMEYLGLAPDGGFHGRELITSLQAIGWFVRANPALWAEFASDAFPALADRLTAMQLASAERRFGWTPAASQG
jgi:hypothetical protein